MRLKEGELSTLQAQLAERLSESITGAEMVQAVSPMLGKCMRAVEDAERSAAESVSAKDGEIQRIHNELERVKSTSLGAVELGEVHVSGVSCLVENPRLRRVACAEQYHGGLRYRNRNDL